MLVFITVSEPCSSGSGSGGSTCAHLVTKHDEC